jgi:hypothetical protein
MDWTTFASLATALGTLVLAIATFGATRSANRSARLSQVALMARIRPLLLSSRPDDRTEKVNWMDEHYERLEGGHGVLKEGEGAIYLAANLRNAGAGLAIMHGWYMHLDRNAARDACPEDDSFRRLTRDLYIAPNDTGFWQGAIRDEADPDRERLLAVCRNHGYFAVDILYGDQEGGQRTVSRFVFTPLPDREGDYFVTTGRHWYLDRDDPR